MRGDGGRVTDDGGRMTGDGLSTVLEDRVALRKSRRKEKRVRSALFPFVPLFLIAGTGPRAQSRGYPCQLFLPLQTFLKNYLTFEFRLNNCLGSNH